MKTLERELQTASEEEEGGESGELVAVDAGPKGVRVAVEKRNRVEKPSFTREALRTAALMEALRVRMDFKVLETALSEKDGLIDHWRTAATEDRAEMKRLRDGGASSSERLGKLEEENKNLRKKLKKAKEDRDAWKEKAGDDAPFERLLTLGMKFGSQLLETWQGNRGSMMPARRLVQELLKLGDPALVADFIAAMEDEFEKASPPQLETKP